jgi:hypothetical protein
LERFRPLRQVGEKNVGNRPIFSAKVVVAGKPQVGIVGEKAVHSTFAVYRH